MIYVPWWFVLLVAVACGGLAVYVTYWACWWSWQPAHGRHAYSRSQMTDTPRIPAPAPAEPDTVVIVSRITDLPPADGGPGEEWADELHRIHEEIMAEPTPLDVFYQQEEEWFRRAREMALGQRALTMADTAEMGR